MTLLLSIMLSWLPAPSWALLIPLSGTVSLAVILRKSTVSWASALIVGLMGFLVATLFWLLATGTIVTSLANAARSAMSAFAIILLAPSASGLLNQITVKMPAVREILLILPQATAYVRTVFDDVQYSHNLEQAQISSRLCRAGLSRRLAARIKIFSRSVSVITNEIVSYCLQWQAVISSRGRLPPLSDWYTPARISPSRFLSDCTIAVVLGAVWLSVV